MLNPDELPALAPRFPFLEAYAGRAAVASLLPQPQAAEPMKPSPDSAPSGSEEDEHRKKFSKKY